MATLFLAMIYSAFVSLGLPDSLLGAAWPEMVSGFAVPVESAGTAAMITSLCTVISSPVSYTHLDVYKRQPVVAFYEKSVREYTARLKLL